jgi:replicative DNA helicase
MKKKNELNTTELEKVVLSFLISQNQEAKVYLMDIVKDEWHKENRQVLNLIEDYIGKNTNIPLNEYLIANRADVSASLLGRLMGNFVSTYAGESAIKNLYNFQQEARVKKTIDGLKDKSLEEIKETLSSLNETVLIKDKPRRLIDVAKERVVEKKLEREAPSTGYKRLDQYIVGFIPGHLYTLSGDTNSGKSTLALNFTHRIAKQGKKSLYFALEPENTVVDYLASIRLKKRFESLTDSDIMYNDENIDIYGKQEISTISKLVSKIKVLPRYDLIVIDHIGYFTTNTSNITTKQSDVMKELAGLAKAKNCAILLIQHLNKSKANKASPENNITGSASFKQDATEVLILVRDKEEDNFGSGVNKDTGAILIRKSKTANPQGAVPVTFIKGTALILDEEDTINAL